MFRFWRKAEKDRDDGYDCSRFRVGSPDVTFALESSAFVWSKPDSVISGGLDDATDKI